MIQSKTLATNFLEMNADQEVLGRGRNQSMGRREYYLILTVSDELVGSNNTNHRFQVMSLIENQKELHYITYPNFPHPFYY